MTKLNLQALTQTGVVRDHNEDMLTLGGIMLRDDAMAFPVELDDESQFYLLVADGMGGHEDGERASEELLKYMDECFKANAYTSENVEDELRSMVKRCNDKLNQQAIDEGQYRPMGTTLTGVVWVRGKAYLINAGDSRTYRFRNGILRQLTKDETVRGITGRPTASKSLLNCIGGGAKGELHVEDISDRLIDGDVLLICSDGLTDMVSDDAIEKILSESDKPADALYDTACCNGGRDNVSIILAEISKA